MCHKCPRLFIPWMPTSYVQESENPEEEGIQHLFGETQSSRFQLVSPTYYGGACRAQQCTRLSTFPNAVALKTRHFARFTAPNPMLFGAVGCSVLVAFSEYLSFSLPGQHPLILWSLPSPGDPWPFSAVAPKYNQTRVAFTSTENFSVFRSFVYAVSHSAQRT